MTKKSKAPLVTGSPQVPPEKGIELIRQQIDKGNALLRSRPIDSDDISQWDLLTKNYLEKAFGFAVVLLTADDIGKPVSADDDSISSSARQNVTFELGYFIGRLGRKRVCALYEENVEIPSDYSGVLYIQLDNSGAWKLQLAREIKAAGIPIDMNLAL